MCCRLGVFLLRRRLCPPAVVAPVPGVEAERKDDPGSFEENERSDGPRGPPRRRRGLRGCGNCGDGDRLGEAYSNPRLGRRLGPRRRSATGVRRGGPRRAERQVSHRIRRRQNRPPRYRAHPQGTTGHRRRPLRPVRRRRTGRLFLQMRSRLRRQRPRQDPRTALRAQNTRPHPPLRQQGGPLYERPHKAPQSPPRPLRR
mmetsp:Transcript_31693/g.101573  ORF Transcript_31693/g.101573 Transcript_31693/m.101573 type:complete len:200 (-) Transcript_31693:439-1038(-)